MSPCGLPSWMWGDPAEVVERLELQATAKVKREAARRRVEEIGLSPVTVRTMRRERIRELVRAALEGGK